MNGHNAVKIIAVNTRAQRRDFIRLPAKIYDQDAAFIARLELEMRELLSLKNPYFAHAHHQHFVAYENGKPVGRISAQVDALTQRKGEPTVGHFGFLDAARPEIVAPLFAAAEAWLRAQGAVRVVGPFSFSINEESGLLVDGFTTPPYLLMNHAPVWLGAAVEAAGYAKTKDLLAFHMDTQTPFPKAAKRLADEAQGMAGLSVRPLNKAQFTTELSSILTIYNEAWRENWGFIALTPEEMAYAAKNMKLLVVPELAQIAEIDGVPAAMIMALPNLMEALVGLRGKLLPFGWAKLLIRWKLRGLTSARVLLMGIRPQFRAGFMSAALSAYLIYRLREACIARRIRYVEMSWILEDNLPMIRLIEAVGGSAYKRYRLYAKELT